MAFETKVTDKQLARAIRACILENDGDLTAIALADKLGVTPAAVYRRVKILREAGLEIPALKRGRRKSTRDVTGLQALLDGEDDGEDDEDTTTAPAPAKAAKPAKASKKAPVVVDDDDED